MSQCDLCGQQSRVTYFFYLVKNGKIEERKYHGLCLIRSLKTHYKNGATFYVSYDDIPSQLAVSKQKIEEILREYKIPDPPHK
jgi:hypothetical protein